MITDEIIITAGIVAMFVVQFLAFMGNLTQEWFIRRWQLSPRSAISLRKTWKIFMNFALLLSIAGVLVVAHLHLR